MKNCIHLYYLLSLLLVTACSTNQDTRQSSKKKQVNFQYDIDQIDFKSPAEIPYNPYSDYFKNPQMQQKDLLFDETLFRSDKGALRKISQEDEQDPIARLIGLCYQKSFVEAGKLMDELYLTYKGHPSYWNQVGTCSFLQGQWDHARLFYNKALELNKNYAPTLNNLGVLYVHENKDQKAFLAFKLSKEASSFSLTPLFNMAQLYLKYSFVKEACNIFQLLSTRNRQDVDATIGLATCQLFKKNYAESVKLFAGLEGNLPERPDGLISYALALKLNGQGPQAKNMLARVSQQELGNWMEYYSQVSHFIEGKQ